MNCTQLCVNLLSRSFSVPVAVSECGQIRRARDSCPKDGRIATLVVLHGQFHSVHQAIARLAAASS